jgi:hypothetical protein
MVAFDGDGVIGSVEIKSKVSLLVSLEPNDEDLRIHQAQ